MKKKTHLQTEQRVRTATPGKRPYHYVDIDELIRQEAIALLSQVKAGLEKLEPRT